MLLGAPSGFWPWTGLWSTLKKSKSGLNPKRSEISRESSSDPYFITNLNSAWEQGTRRTSRQAQLPKLPEKAVTIRESSGTYFRVPKASWTDHILWGLYVSICGGKQAWGGGSADILMLYPTPAASLWGLRQALFTWAGCCGPIALLRDKVRGGTSKRTQRDGFLVGCICRNSWCRCLGDGLCGSNCHDFHICEPRGYKETRGTSENLNHPGVSWHHDVKNILLDRWLISHY